MSETREMGMSKGNAKKRWMTGAALAVVALAGAALVARGRTAPRAEGAIGLPLPAGTPVVAAQWTRRAAYWRAPGEVRARQQAVVAARVSGYITAMRAHLGDRVRAGQVLAVLATPQAGQQVRAAAAAVAAAQAQRAAAERQLAAARAQAALAASTYRRYAQLRAEQAVSPYEMEQVATARQSRQALAAAARAQLQAAAAQLGRARAGLAQSEIAAGYGRVRAPFAGRITARPAAVGDLAMPGQPLYKVAGAVGSKLRVSVPDRELRWIHLGERVRVTGGGAGDGASAGRWATVRRMAPASDAATHMAVVELRLPAGGGWRPGAFATAAFPLAATRQLWLPSGAVLRAGGLSEVYVVNRQRRAELRWVRTGGEAGGQVEILAGLTGNETVVAAPRELAAGGGGEAGLTAGGAAREGANGHE